MDKMTHTKFNLNNFLMAFSDPLDNIISSNRYGIKYSSKRVAYIALKLATITKFSPSLISDIFSYAIICKNSIALNNIENIPFNSIDINKEKSLLDIIDISIQIEENLNIKDNIIINKDEIISKFGSEDTKELFDEISFWYDLTSISQLPFFIFSYLSDFTMELQFDKLINLAKVFNDIVYDFTNRKYENSIDQKATKIAQYYQFDKKDSARFIVATLFGNIGYLNIPNKLITKSTPLTQNELEIFQSVPYHTKNILTQIFGFDDIAQLGGYIYERLDGSGYPYKVQGNNLSLKNRVLTILNIYQALQEDRVYRIKYSKDKIKDILNQMVDDGYLDGTIVVDILNILVD